MMTAVSYGMGVDSTAMLVGMHQRGWRPDIILFADTGGEKQITYEYFPIICAWLKSVEFPLVQIVRYRPKKFKHWPPYYTLEDNCLTNGTLPSLAFGFKSCSLKWKVAPQNAYMKTVPIVQELWNNGGKVEKLIGYDAGPIDARRYAGGQHGLADEFYDYRYPLVEWGWDRVECIRQITDAGLPVPPKSSCFFCPAMKPGEVRALEPHYLRRIITLESRSRPRLTDIEGLWRNGTSGKRSGHEPRPGTMTEFIIRNGLLPLDEIHTIMAEAPLDIIEYQQGYAAALKDGNAATFEVEMSDDDYREKGGMPDELACCGA